VDSPVHGNAAIRRHLPKAGVLKAVQILTAKTIHMPILCNQQYLASAW